MLRSSADSLHGKTSPRTACWHPPSHQKTRPPIRNEQCIVEMIDCVREPRSMRGGGLLHGHVSAGPVTFVWLAFPVNIHVTWDSVTVSMDHLPGTLQSCHRWHDGKMFRGGFENGLSSTRGLC